jgi:hypothetical protein
LLKPRLHIRFTFFAILNILAHYRCKSKLGLFFRVRRGGLGSYLVSRIAYCVSRGGLGLFGFVFSSRAGRFIFITLCKTSGCLGLGVEWIGFVLRKKGRFVERARQM